MIEKTVKDLAQGANFAALTTLFKSGRPQTNIMWVDADDEHILINTEIHRQKYKNVQVNDQFAVAIFDATNPYHYAEVRGHLVGEVRGDEARAHIDSLSRKYTGKDYQNPIQSERVILQFVADHQRVQ